MILDNDVLKLKKSNQNCDFEHEFFSFRSLVRDLEGQMAHVMRICFDRCVNTADNIRLLEVFSGISGRESVQKSLADKLNKIIEGLMEEVCVSLITTFRIEVFKTRFDKSYLYIVDEKYGTADSRTELRQRTELRLYKWLVTIPFVSQFSSGSERNCDYTTFRNTITRVY